MTTNYREILRLDSLGLNKTDIASAAQCARNTVSTTLERANACGFRWPLPDNMSDKELEEKLFPSAPGKAAYKMPDYRQATEAGGHVKKGEKAKLVVFWKPYEKVDQDTGEITTHCC